MAFGHMRVWGSLSSGGLSLFDVRKSGTKVNDDLAGSIEGQEKWKAQKEHQQ